MKKLLLLPLALILFAAPMADDLLVEGFEGGNMPPMGWDVWDLEPDSAYWGVDSGGAHSGTYYAYCATSYGIDSWLVTPTMDMSGYENLSFSCWYMECSSGSFTGIYVMGSDVLSPGPGDFVEVGEVGAPPGSWTERTVDASAFDGASDVTFAIRCVYGSGRCTHFDDISVTADVNAVESASLGEIKAIYR